MTKKRKQSTLRTKMGFNKYNHVHNMNFLFGVKPVKVVWDDNLFFTFVIYVDSSAINTESRKDMVENYQKYYEVKIKTL